MHHFAYRDGALHAEDVDLARIAEAVGTPFYCYSTATIERHYRVFAQAFAGAPRPAAHPFRPQGRDAHDPRALARRAAAGGGGGVEDRGALRDSL